MNKSIALAAFAAAAASSHAFSYFEDFQGSVGAEWSSSLVSAAPADASRKFLGRFDNSTVTLTLTGLTVGQAATIKFDLYVTDSWDGNQGGVGPDYFTFEADGNALLDATFANVSSYQQSYSAGNPLGGPAVAAYTDADEVNTLGYNFYGNSVYKFGGSGANAAFTYVPTSTTLSLSFAGSGLQGVSDEGWGIDNVSVEAVPEPASMAAIAMGLAAVARKRRK